MIRRVPAAEDSDDIKNENDEENMFERLEEGGGNDNRSEGTEMVAAYNEIDIEQIYEKIQAHDPKFDRDSE